MEKKLTRIPLVTASEPGIAQLENLPLENCSLAKRPHGLAGTQVGSNAASERVITPSVPAEIKSYHEVLSTSRVAWECSPNWEVNPF